jgi:hypothetical protein
MLSGKDKASRVPLNYFRGSGRRKWIVTFIALLVVGILVGVSVASGYWRHLASPGKVHRVHAAFESDCAVCHTPLQPTSSRNGLKGLFGVGPVSDDLCKSCHLGPVHHATEKEGDVGACSSCHAEHRGRTSDLSAVRDSSCARCHDNLTAHVKDGKTDFATKVTSIAGDHPQFRVGTGKERAPLDTAVDPGKLKFNHKAHLTAGIRYEEGDSGGWTLGQIRDPALRERYRKTQPKGKDSDKDLVQLDCASCHQLDATDAPKAGPGQSLPLRTRGDFMLPVSYEQHCQACHPLSFDPALPSVQIPHLLQPEQVKRFLWGVYTERAAAAPGLAKKLATGRPLPGQNLSRVEQEERKRIEGEVGKVSSFLFRQEQERATQFVLQGRTTCGLCHHYEGAPDAKVPPKIVPPNVPQVWYPHATFSHAAHKAVQCAACHDGAAKSTQSLDVLLPGVANCRTCHAPGPGLLTSLKGGEPKEGGVRHECVTCHRYHNNDAPFAGLGAAARGAKARRTIRDFLDGK